jgi:hypothetical protein
LNAFTVKGGVNGNWWKREWEMGESRGKQGMYEGERKEGREGRSRGTRNRTWTHYPEMAGHQHPQADTL